MLSTAILLVLYSIYVSAGPPSVSESFDESFEYTGTNDTCPYYQYGLSCADPLPGPVNGLSFDNLQADNVFLHQGPQGQGTAEGEWYAAYKDSSKPAVLSAQYDKSCVRYWTLGRIAAACSAQQNFTDTQRNMSYVFTYGYNCTLDVIGKNSIGRIMGKERFSYNPGPLQFDFRGLPYWQMQSFNTTKGLGLNGKQISRLEIYAKPVIGNDSTDSYVGGFNAALDAISYTVVNKTGCSARSRGGH